ncbi:ubiquitin-conjugating enzyme E2-binding protein [Powellomyces hirtus]|nr:ubiquitin-conjugating enzyme E2-binding protein [Powellomyces hirtus]
MLSSPMAFPSVYMEILPKIRSLNISIVTPGGFPDPTITEAHISIPAHSDVPPQTLGLPFEVDPSSAVIRRGKDGFDIKVSLRHQAHLPEPPNNAASDASSLEVLLHVRCHFCEHDVLPPGAAATTSRFRKVVDLPSEYWHELTDCWACHKEDYSQMPGQKGGVVLAQPGVVLVGNSYIVLHPDDVDFTALEVDLEEKAKGVLRVGRTAPAHCTNCHEPIGDFQFDQIPTSQDQVRKQVHGIKLYKYRVDFTTLASPHHPLPYRPFVSYFVNELGDSTEAHAAYRFAICEKDAAGPTFLCSTQIASLERR